MSTTGPATPGDPQSFNQGHQESQPAPSQEPEGGIQIISAPQPNQDPNQPTGPAPAESPVGPNGERYFTSEDIERARREEKDKLYGTIEELKGKVGELSESEKARLAAEEARIKAEQDAQRKAEEAEMNALELIKKREEEWAKDREEFTGQVQTLQQQIEQQNALMERERQLQELEQYKARRMAESGENIMPHLRSMVSGTTPEEIEHSISQMQQTSAAIMQDMAQATNEAPRPSQPGPRVTMPPVGPMDTQSAQRSFTAEDIARMSPGEYAQHRESLLAAAGRQVRDQGPYDR